MEGTDRGHAEETLASDACVAFVDCAGAMSEWAERVLERDRANRCDVFRPKERASGDAPVDERAKAKAALDALFEK